MNMKKNNKNQNNIQLSNQNNSDLTPVVVYENAELQKKQIKQENKGISGIYRWINTVNGKSYIGSAVNLGRRFSEYYSKEILG